ncbi:hypothetical protein BDV26DRAFT_277497 [Aspergillus bertholletiae]|uniref:PD-(D/E)XK nuclease-like domain-containing protein n=1 Tax=Aspergillus bertholletiae TaxID=1226010 RepID=A0A5N7BNG1_9EURO|nr:hypothetical protein BDV26DRAFT_277497 [Aspergillus bertholletiae]
MIDLCVYASFDGDTELSASIIKLCRITPTLAVNHTDFDPINERPLLLSIETKKSSIDWNTALLEIGTWHATQWSFLQWAVRQKMIRQLTEMPKTNEEEEKFNANLLAILSALGAMPGIIIQGHRWFLILSTYENEKIKVWTGHQFGTTESYLGVYTVIAGMRQLTAWGRDTYLPWFMANVLF